MTQLSLVLWVNVLMVKTFYPINCRDQCLQVFHLNVIEVFAHLVFNDLHRFILCNLSHAITLLTFFKYVLRMRSGMVLVHLDADSTNRIVEPLDYSHRLRGEGQLLVRDRSLRRLLDCGDLPTGADELHQIGLRGGAPFQISDRLVVLIVLGCGAQVLIHH